ALIEERVVGVEQLQHASVFSEHALKKQLRLLLERLAQALIELRKRVRVRLHLVDRAHIEPLSGEVADQRLRSRIVQHAPHLLRQHGGIFQLALLRQSEELVVRDAAPQEERETGSQFDIADAVNTARGAALWIVLDAEEKIRRDQHRANRFLDAVVEV